MPKPHGIYMMISKLPQNKKTPPFPFSLFTLAVHYFSVCDTFLFGVYEEVNKLQFYSFTQESKHS